METLTIEHNDAVVRHQSLVEKAVQLVKDIEAARDKVGGKTTAIDDMRESRDEKVKKIARLKTGISLLCVSLSVSTTRITKKAALVFTLT